MSRGGAGPTMRLSNASTNAEISPFACSFLTHFARASGQRRSLAYSPQRTDETQSCTTVKGVICHSIPRSMHPACMPFFEVQDLDSLRT